MKSVKTVKFIASEISQLYIVEPVYHGHLGANQKCPDYQGVLIFQVSLYDKAAPFGTITKCVDYAGVLISSVLICTCIQLRPINMPC